MTLPNTEWGNLSRSIVKFLNQVTIQPEFLTCFYRCGDNGLYLLLIPALIMVSLSLLSNSWGFEK